MTAPRWHDLVLDQVRARGDAPAFHDSTGVAWTWGQTGTAIDAAADCLRDLGVQAGDRVLLVAENCAAAVAFLFASSQLGAAVTPFNARQTERELARVIAHAAPAAVVLTEAVSPEAADHAARLGASRRMGAFGAVSVLARTSQPDLEALHDVAVILYTTGTTGDPKGVMLTHGNMRFGGEASAQLRWMVPEDVIYGVLPISHIFGLASIVTGASVKGAHVKFEARFSAKGLHMALQGGVTLLSAVPQMHAMLMQYVKEEGFERLDSPHLRYVSSGGAPLDPDWKRRAEAFYGVPLQNGYGMTETAAGVAVTQHRAANDDISCGPPLPGVEMRIRDGQAEGEWQVRGGCVMKGYYRALEATAEVLDADGWFSTGDLGRFDDAGNVYILGRSKELIIHGGFNVYPPEVEAVLSDHPQVIQAAVIGHMVAGDEKVLAFCQVAPGDAPDMAELRRFVADRLAGYKRPFAIVLSPTLPAAATGKILKHKLKDAFAAELAALGA